MVLGLTLAAHGYNKFFGGGRIPGTGRWFDSMGMKPNGRIHAILAASTEMAAGLLFAAGLLTPLAAAGFVGLMVVAGWTVHRHNGFFIVKEGWEYNLALAVTAVGVAVVGPGRYSLDWTIGLDVAFNPGVAFVLSGVLGLVAGAGLVAPPATGHPPPTGADTTLARSGPPGWHGLVVLPPGPRQASAGRRRGGDERVTHLVAG